MKNSELLSTIALLSILQREINNELLMIKDWIKKMDGIIYSLKSEKKDF